MTAKQKKQQIELLNKLHAKYYGKKKSKARDSKAPGETPERPKVSFNAGPSRHSLCCRLKPKA